MPKKLKDFKPHGSGSWTLPTDEKTSKLCKSLANNGIRAICTHSTVWAKNIKRDTTYPLSYLQVYKNKPLDVEGTFGCYLNSDQVDKQIYVGPTKATWSEKPTNKELNLSGRAKTVEAGTVLISAPGVEGLDGAAYCEPRMTVVVPE